MRGDVVIGVSCFLGLFRVVCHPHVARGPVQIQLLQQTFGFDFVGFGIGLLDDIFNRSLALMEGSYVVHQICQVPADGTFRIAGLRYEPFSAWKAFPSISIVIVCWARIAKAVTFQEYTISLRWMKASFANATRLALLLRLG